MNRAMAGTASVSPNYGVRIVSETVKEHKDSIGNVTFRELVGLELEERWPGALKEARVTFLREPSNVKLTGCADSKGVTKK